ncbi:MAG: hypothetical protein U0939_26050 [Pirellulales bacterium]
MLRASRRRSYESIWSSCFSGAVLVLIPAAIFLPSAVVEAQAKKTEAPGKFTVTCAKLVQGHAVGLIVDTPFLLVDSQGLDVANECAKVPAGQTPTSDANGQIELAVPKLKSYHLILDTLQTVTSDRFDPDIKIPRRLTLGSVNAQSKVTVTASSLLNDFLSAEDVIIELEHQLAILQAAKQPSARVRSYQLRVGWLITHLRQNAATLVFGSPPGRQNKPTASVSIDVLATPASVPRVAPTKALNASYLVCDSWSRFLNQRVSAGKVVKVQPGSLMRVTNTKPTYRNGVLDIPTLRTICATDGNAPPRDAGKVEYDAAITVCSESAALFVEEQRIKRVEMFLAEVQRIKESALVEDPDAAEKHPWMADIGHFEQILANRWWVDPKLRSSRMELFTIHNSTLPDGNWDQMRATAGNFPTCVLWAVCYTQGDGIQSFRQYFAQTRRPANMKVLGYLSMSQGDAQKWLAEIELWRTVGVDGLFLDGFRSQAARPLIDAARQRGMNVFARCQNRVDFSIDENAESPLDGVFITRGGMPDFEAIKDFVKLRLLAQPDTPQAALRKVRLGAWNYGVNRPERFQKQFEDTIASCADVAGFWNVDSDDWRQLPADWLWKSTFEAAALQNRPR